MWWKVYKWDGRYIQGEYISKHRTKEKALEKAVKAVKHIHSTYENKNNEEVVWLENKDHIPVGMIIKEK